MKMINTKLILELNKEELKKLMVYGSISSISKTLDTETRITIKLRSRNFIPPNKIDEVFPL